MGEHYDNRYREYLNIIEGYLNDILPIDPSIPQKNLIEAMRYSLLAGGKRLRPVFTLDFCKMCGGEFSDALPFAAAVEMIHTYSLIHDDLPCMDNDDYRRGRLTNHKVYGEAMAVLAGDALLTDAFRIAATADLSGSAIAEGVGILAGCAGSEGMVGGQVLDISSEERVLSEGEVLQIQSRKTGALIRAACTTGVLCGGGSREQQDAAGCFAAQLGLAFQIRDDMLDVIGTQEEMGKGVGTDETKNTFVRLYGLERCEELVQTYTALAIDALSVFPNNGYMTALAKSLTDRRV
jgi:geranylgeranyl diphosphate synthase type II